MEMPRRFEVEPPRRVLIVGSPGAGAGKLARLVCERFSLPLIDLAAVSEPRIDGATCDLKSIAEAGDWVIVCHDAVAADLLVRRAEWFIWLDLSVSTCLTAILREHVLARFSRKPPKKPESGNASSLWAHLLAAAHYPAETVPRLLKTVERERRNRAIYILRSKGEVREFVSTITSDVGGADGLHGNSK